MCMGERGTRHQDEAGTQNGCVGGTYKEGASSSGVYKAKLTGCGTWFKRREKYTDRVKENILSSLISYGQQKLPAREKIPDLK